MALHQPSHPRSLHNIRRLKSRPGCVLPGPNRKRSLVPSGGQTTHKCSRAQSGLSYNQSLPERPLQHHSVSVHGQHLSRSPCKQQLISLTLELWQWCLQKSILITAQHLRAKSTTWQTESQESFTTPANGK